MKIPFDLIRLLDAKVYATSGFPHDEATFLRKNSPVTWVESEEFPAFWAITKHQDIRELPRSLRILSELTSYETYYKVGWN